MKKFVFLAVLLFTYGVAFADSKIVITPKALKAALELTAEQRVSAPQVFVFNKDRQLVLVGEIGQSQSIEEIVDYLDSNSAEALVHPISKLVQSKLLAVPTIAYITSPESQPCSACDQYYPQLDAAIAERGIKVDRIRIELDFQ